MCYMDQTALEGKWVLGGGVEIPCSFYILASEVYRRLTRRLEDKRYDQGAI